MNFLKNAIVKCKIVFVQILVITATVYLTIKFQFVMNALGADVHAIN